MDFKTNWLNEEMASLDLERRKKLQDPKMSKKMICILAFLGILLYSSASFAFDSPEARRIPISGDLWKCSECGNLQVNRNPKCDFCGKGIDRD